MAHISDLTQVSNSREESTFRDNSDQENENLKEERHRVVKLQTEPEFLDGITIAAAAGIEEQEITTIECRPFAVLLRFRVAQIVCGIVTLLLGVVACLEPETRTTLSLGIPTGLLTALSAVAHVQSSREEFSAGLIASNPMIRMVSGIRRTLSDPYRCGNFLQYFYPLIPTFTCIFSCVLLLVLAVRSIFSSEPNSHVLGILQTVSCLLVLSIELMTWIMKWKWSKVQQRIANNNRNHEFQTY